MKKVSFAKRISRSIVAASAVVVLFSGGIFGLSVTGHAADTLPITGGAVSTDGIERSITVWKYQINDLSELGGRGDGEKVELNSTKYPPLKDITFSIQKVSANPGETLTDPVKDAGKYTIDSSVTIPSQTTLEDGSAIFSLGDTTSADGVYLITEEPNPSVSKPADPFFVYVPLTRRDTQDSLIYNVQVQPKNMLSNLLYPDKTVEGGKGYSIKAGQPFQWEATTDIPAGIYYKASQDMDITPIYDKDGSIVTTNPGSKLEIKKDDEVFGDYFTITDTLVKDLEILSVTMQVHDPINDVWDDLTLGTDYTVSLNGNLVSTGPVTAPSGVENIVVNSLTKDGMKATKDKDKIRVVYETTVKQDFNGKIENEFEVAYQTPGLKPVTEESNPPDPNDPTKPKDPNANPVSYYGGFNILKTTENADETLEGAVFHIAASEADAKAYIFLGTDGVRYGKLDGTGTSIQDALDAAGAVGLLSTTSGVNGKAEFNGLALDWYEDLDGNGQQDPTTEPTKPEDQIQKDYWVVETKAPKGYELLKTPQKVTVSLSTADNVVGNTAADELVVTNKKQTNLPFTGGTGRTILIVIAVGAITIGTAAIIIDKKKQKA